MIGTQENKITKVPLLEAVAQVRVVLTMKSRILLIQSPDTSSR
jgi:hypothetical protein